MKKYVHRHRKARQPLTEEEILKFRNFEQVRLNYERATKDLYRKKLYRDPKLFLGLLLVLLILWILWGTIEEEEQQPERDSRPPSIESTK